MTGQRHRDRTGRTTIGIELTATRARFARYGSPQLMPGRSAAMRACVILFVLPLLSCIEQPYRFYDSYPDAVDAGELERGWLPRWVPPAADAIHLRGDLDTNERWLRFRVPENAARALVQSSTRGATEVRARRPPRSSQSWWNPETVLAAGEPLLSRAGDGHWVLVVGRGSQAEVYAWSVTQ